MQRSGHDARHSDFYPRPPRGGRRTPCPRLRHSPNFYPRPPRGGRPACSDVCHVMPPFLSTPSARRATSTPNSVRCCCTNFYPRPPRGGRPPCRHPADRPSNFYPRPPRGGRPSLAHLLIKPVRFLSTPSARRATRNPGFMWRTSGISIHALREEGDRSSGRQPQQW